MSFQMSLALVRIGVPSSQHCGWPNTTYPNVSFVPGGDITRSGVNSCRRTRGEVRWTSHFRPIKAMSRTSLCAMRTKTRVWSIRKSAGSMSKESISGMTRGSQPERRRLAPDRRADARRFRHEVGGSIEAVGRVLVEVAARWFIATATTPSRATSSSISPPNSTGSG